MTSVLKAVAEALGASSDVTTEWIRKRYGGVAAAAAATAFCTIQNPGVGVDWAICIIERSLPEQIREPESE